MFKGIGADRQAVLSEQLGARRVRKLQQGEG